MGGFLLFGRIVHFVILCVFTAELFGVHLDFVEDGVLLSFWQILHALRDLPGVNPSVFGPCLAALEILFPGFVVAAATHFEAILACILVIVSPAAIGVVRRIPLTAGVRYGLLAEGAPILISTRFGRFIRILVIPDEFEDLLFAHAVTILVNDDERTARQAGDSVPVHVS